MPELSVKSSMKKHSQPTRKVRRSRHSLGELVSALSSCTRNSREATVALLDLFKTNRILINDHGRLKRVRVYA